MLLPGRRTGVLAAVMLDLLYVSDNVVFRLCNDTSLLIHLHDMLGTVPATTEVGNEDSDV